MALLTLGGFSPTDDGAPLLLLPPVLAASPIVVRGTPLARAVRVVVAVVFAGLWFVAAASVGWFFAPAALLATAAAAAAVRHNGV